MLFMQTTSSLHYQSFSQTVSLLEEKEFTVNDVPDVLYFCIKFKVSFEFSHACQYNYSSAHFTLLSSWHICSLKTVVNLVLFKYNTLFTVISLYNQLTITFGSLKNIIQFIIPGTCINNTSVMMFKKGSFEVGGTIYPAAIKVQTCDL